MKKDEQLKRAINALRVISDPGNTFPREYAAKVLQEITTPKMEMVDKTIYSVVFPDGSFNVFKHRHDANALSGYEDGIVFEHTIKYQRPVEEKEPDVWEGEVLPAPTNGYVQGLPEEWIGKTVEVMLKEGE